MWNALGRRCIAVWRRFCPVSTISPLFCSAVTKEFTFVVCVVPSTNVIPVVPRSHQIASVQRRAVVVFPGYRTAAFDFDLAIEMDKGRLVLRPRRGIMGPGAEAMRNPIHRRQTFGVRARHTQAQDDHCQYGAEDHRAVTDRGPLDLNGHLAMLRRGGAGNLAHALEGRKAAEGMRRKGVFFRGATSVHPFLGVHSYASNPALLAWSSLGRDPGADFVFERAGKLPYNESIRQIISRAVKVSPGLCCAPVKVAVSV